MGDQSVSSFKVEDEKRECVLPVSEWSRIMRREVRETFESDLDSLRIVENDTERITLSRADATHAVPEVHTIHAFLALHWPIMNRKQYPLSLSQRDNDRSRLHSRPLFCHHKFSPREMLVRL